MKILLIILIPLLFQVHIAHGFSYDTAIKVHSLEDKKCTLSLHSNYVDDILEIKLLNGHDKLCLQGFRQMDGDVTVLNGKFMMLHIAERGGSGTAVTRTVIICISDDKLFDALDIESMVRSTFDKTYNHRIDSLNLYDEHELYKVELKVDSDEENGLVADITNFVSSKYDPSQNRDDKSIKRLKFDFVNKCFFNQEVALKGNYKIFSDSSYSISYSPLFIYKDSCFAINLLYDHDYFIMDGIWYSEQRDKYLIKREIDCK